MFRRREIPTLCLNALSVNINLTCFNKAGVSSLRKRLFDNIYLIYSIILLPCFRLQKLIEGNLAAIIIQGVISMTLNAIVGTEFIV